MSDQLSTDEQELWHLWKHMGEGVREQIARDIGDATGLSDPDYGVLSRLADAEHRQLRQQSLADSMGWSKSRLSHHLTRMEERRLVTRQSMRGENGSLVSLTPAGQSAIELARPIHAQAVRRHLLDRLQADEKALLLALAQRLKS